MFKNFRHQHQKQSKKYCLIVSRVLPQREKENHDKRYVEQRVN